MARSRTVGIIVSAVVALSGCASLAPRHLPDPFDDDPALFLGGVHLRWIDDDSVEARGYLINLANSTFDHPRNVVASRLIGQGSHYPDPDEEIQPSFGNWTPGEVRPWAARFHGLPAQAFRLEVTVPDSPGWNYLTDCRTREGSSSTECADLVAGRPRITTETEADWYPQTIACCEWLPPPFDPHNLACEFAVSEVRCTLRVWNFMSTSHEGTAELILWTAPTRGVGANREVAREAVTLGDAFAPRETRTLEATIPIDPALILSNASAAYEVELRVARADLPKSVANATAPLDVRTSAGVVPLVHSDSLTGGSLYAVHLVAQGA